MRAHITALEDRELARMPTVDAENCRDEALAIGGEEAARRKLGVSSSVRGLEPSIPHAPKRKRQVSMLFTRLFPVAELAEFRSATGMVMLSTA